MELYLTYLLTCTLIISTPGPSAFLMMKHASIYGIQKCLFNALGSISASSVLIVVSLAGVSFFLTPAIINFLSIIGGLFLISISFSCFKEIKSESEKKEFEKNNSISIYKDSFITGITNPKDIIFFVSFLPQFLMSDMPYFLGGIFLLLGWVILDFSIMMGYSVLAKSYIGLSNNGKSIRNIRAISGSFIFFIGVFILFSSIKFFLTEI